MSPNFYCWVIADGWLIDFMAYPAFVRYADAQNRISNIEATPGVLLTDQQYINNFEINTEAIIHAYICNL